MDHADLFALHIFQRAPGEDLGHGQHTVQGRANLMAHIGEELRLCDIGRLRQIARLDQIVERAAQRLVLQLQAAHQHVEALGEAADLVRRAGRDTDLEGAALAHRLHRLRQTGQGLGDARGQPAAEEQRQRGGGEEHGRAEGEIAADRSGAGDGHGRDPQLAGPAALPGQHGGIDPRGPRRRPPAPRRCDGKPGDGHRPPPARPRPPGRRSEAG